MLLPIRSFYRSTLNNFNNRPLPTASVFTRAPLSAVYEMDLGNCMLAISSRIAFLPLHVYRLLFFHLFAGATSGAMDKAPVEGSGYVMPFGVSQHGTSRS